MDFQDQAKKLKEEGLRGKGGKNLSYPGGESSFGRVLGKRLSSQVNLNVQRLVLEREALGRQGQQNRNLSFWNSLPVDR